VESSKPISTNFEAVILFSTLFAPHFNFVVFPGEQEYLGVHRSGWKTAMNALAPLHMTAGERLDEIAEILALGLMRLHASQSTRFSRNGGDGSLDYVGHQSGHANPEISGEQHG
jgi:hypothetical protein